VLCALLVAVFGVAPAWAKPCPAANSAVNPTPAVNGWGFGVRNHRFIAESQAGITQENIDGLALQWVFALPDTTAPRFLPLVTEDSVLITDTPGIVYALDRDTGCEKWRFDVGSAVRTTLTYIPRGDAHLVVLGTFDGEMLALDLLTGEAVWRFDADDHPRAMLSGSPVYHAGVIYQPVSSWEVMWAANPFYSCCTFRGSVLAVSAATGEILWRTYTIDREPEVVIERFLLPDHIGPSGAPVWSQPTLDLDRGLLYVGTGENYSAPPTDTSDAILALDMETGDIVWQRQFTSGDAWNLSCEVALDINCPPDHGEDLDFGAPPILARAGQQEMILAGQKSGRVYGLDPERTGEPVWSARLGAGGKVGGVHFAMAVDTARGVLYVPVSDRSIGDAEHEPNPSLHALDILTGESLWETAAPGDCVERPPGEEPRPIDECFPGFSAAPTATENLVFAPTLDGFLRAFDADDGAELWAFDTRGMHPAVNGGEALGGAFDLGGVMLDRGQLFVASGYGQFGQLPGNAFMVFAVDSSKR